LFASNATAAILPMARTNALPCPHGRPRLSSARDQEHGMEDIRSVPHFCASPAFLLEKN
jgi:hypothetical protein